MWRCGGGVGVLAPLNHSASPLMRSHYILTALPGCHDIFKSMARKRGLEDHDLQMLQPELMKVTFIPVRKNHVGLLNCKGMEKYNPLYPGKRRTRHKGEHQKSPSKCGLSHKLSPLPLDE